MMESNNVGNSFGETVMTNVSDNRTEPLVNGLSNGTTSKSDRHSKHKHKDKDRDRDRKEGDKGRNKERDRHKEHKQKDKDKERSKHSDSKERHGSSNSKTDEKKDKERKEKGKEQKDKDRGDKSSSKHRDHKSSSSKSKSSKHSSEKERHSSKHKHSSKEKNHHDNEKCDQQKTEVKVKIEENEDTSDRLIIDEGTYTSIVKTEPKLEIPDVKRQTNSLSMERQDSSPEYNNFVKNEDDSDDELPLANRSSGNTKRRFAIESDDEEELSLNARKKIKKEKSNGHSTKRKTYGTDESEEDLQPVKKKKSHKKEIKKETNNTDTPTKKKKKPEEEEQEVWKWWEEEKKDDGVKWNFLEHKGPMFAPPYEPLPADIKFIYDGKPMKLSEETEEVATFYAKMLDHDYTTKEAFNKNFFKDWRKTMTSTERSVITDLKKCNFKNIQTYFLAKTEERKAMSKEEKKKLKEQNEEIAKEYGVCTIDGHKEKIGNFRIEPPGLFRGRGEHPKMGMLKKRVNPEDVIINCSKKAKIPTPPKGHKWKEVRHDNTVTWLASWTENVQGQVKYVMLNPSSKLKGEKDWQKYETARKLAKSVEKIRKDYREDWKSKEMRIRQRAVAMYFIDRLALRAGNEKDEDQADTVGCCSLRVEHIQLHEQKDGKEYVVVFDFLGKDSIRYYNELPVEKRVFKNLQLFCERKKGSDDLFDRLNTAVLNKHLNELMEGLTAKVFRTFNASWTLQNQLNELTDPDASIPEKILQYNRANRAVAILCNHQRSIPKSHEKSMGNLKQKIEQKKQQVTDATRQYKDAKREAKNSSHGKVLLEKKKKTLDRLKEQLMKLEVQETDKEENKTIALGTSKLNYLDPRISVAWCKKHGVPIEKIYNKTQRSKFRWAIDMAGPDFVF